MLTACDQFGKFYNFHIYIYIFGKKQEQKAIRILENKETCDLLF